MTQTPLERAARALGERNGDGDWEYWLDDARAVIAAIREPSDAMRAAVGEMLMADNHTIDCNEADIWHTMIDAILDEETI